MTTKETQLQTVMIQNIEQFKEQKKWIELLEIYYGCETSIDIGFGSLDFYPGITSEEIHRIHTVTKEMTIEEIEEKLGYKIKIVKENNNDTRRKNSFI